MPKTIELAKYIAAVERAYAFRAFAIFRATARGAKRVEKAPNLFLKPEMATALFFMNAA